jgi:hypothetical protein
MNAPAKPVVADPTKPQTNPQLTPAPFRITPIKQSHRYIKALIYGPFGTGKTSLAASAVDVPGMDDVIFVNAESGTMSVQEAEHIVNREYIDQVQCNDFKTVALVQEFLTNHCIARDNNDLRLLKVLQARTFGYSPDIIDEECEEDEYNSDDINDPDRTITRARLRKYRTAIIDSLTEVDTLSMYQLLGIKTDMKLDQEMDVAEWAEFRKNNQLMQLLVRAYRNLPMNVIMVSGNQYTQDEIKRFNWTPAITGKLANQVQGFVDLVGYLTNGKPLEGKDEIPRRLYIQPIGNFDAKSRIASYKKPFIDNPTMGKIMNAFRNVGNLKQEPKAK